MNRGGALQQGPCFTPRRASKKQKKTAEFRPLLKARGPTPAKKGLMPAPCCITSLDALDIVGRELAEHIITCTARYERLDVT